VGFNLLDDVRKQLANKTEQLRAFLFRRKIAYSHTFNLESPYVQTVLEDLARFCRANKTCFHENDRVQAHLEGRREVWLRLMEHINTTSDEFWKKYGRDE